MWGERVGTSEAERRRGASKRCLAEVYRPPPLKRRVGHEDGGDNVCTDHPLAKSRLGGASCLSVTSR